MRNINFIATFTLLIIAAYSCKTAEAQDYSKFNYNDLYKVWVVDTIIVLNSDDFSTPDLEMNKNEYEFTKDGTNPNQGTRKAITPLGPTFIAPYTLKDGIINIDMLYPISKIDESGNLISYNPYGVPVPPYKISELSSTKLTLKNKDIIIKMRAK